MVTEFRYEEWKYIYFGSFIIFYQSIDNGVLVFSLVYLPICVSSSVSFSDHTGSLFNYSQVVIDAE